MILIAIIISSCGLTPREDEESEGIPVTSPALLDVSPVPLFIIIAIGVLIDGIAIIIIIITIILMHTNYHIKIAQIPNHYDGPFERHPNDYHPSAIRGRCVKT